MTIANDIGTLINQSPNLHNGRPVISRTGTSVHRIAALYKQGANAEEIARRMKHLSLAQVYAALTYYHANRGEIEADLAEEDAKYWELVSLHNKKIQQHQQ